MLHYGFTLPADVSGPITIEAILKYRKFDTAYMRALFDYGYSLGPNGYPWMKVPPGMKPPATSGAGN